MAENSSMPERAKILEKYPDYRIDIEPADRQIQVVAAGEIVADTDRALALHESFHGPVYYLPRDDVRMNLLIATEHRTHCPFKGDASYWTIDAGGKTLENAVWSYEEPFPEISAIRGYMAFYADRVDEIRVI